MHCCFSGELGNYCDTSLCCTTVHYTESRNLHPAYFVQQIVSCALGKGGIPRMAPKDEQLIAIQHVYTAKMFLWLPTDAESTHVCILLFVFVPHIHFGKEEMAYCHCGLAGYISAWCSCTLQLYILPNISLCYLQVTYLNELYSATAHTCVNSG